MWRTVLIPLLLLCSLAASPAAAFRNVAAGATVDNPALLAADGMIEPLLASYCGAPSVVVFWATWSPRSAAALADLQGLYADSDLSVAAVNVDTEAGAPVAAAADEVEFPVFLDRELTLYRQWGVVAVPSLALVDGTGQVVRTLDGYAPGEREVFLGEAAAAAAAEAGRCASASRMSGLARAGAVLAN